MTAPEAQLLQIGKGVVSQPTEPFFFFFCFFSSFLQKHNAENCRMNSLSIWDILDPPLFMNTEPQTAAFLYLPGADLIPPSETATPPGEHNTSSALEGKT
jgi:hypothetical protein